MTSLDLAFLTFVAVLGLLGAISGAIRQLTHWSGLLLAYLFARPLATRLTPAVTPRLAEFMPSGVTLPPAVVNMGLTSALFSAIFILGTVIIAFIVSKTVAAYEQGRGDRAAGFALGALKGAVLVYAAVAVLLFVEKPLAQAFGTLPQPVAGSMMVGLVRAHNPLESAPLPALTKLETLMEAVRDPKRAETLLHNPELLKMLVDPALAPALKDKELQKALSSGDWSALKDDPRIKKMLEDPRLKSASLGIGAQR